MKKISFENIKNVLSRSEMKKIMAGSGGFGCGTGISCDDKEEFESCGTSGGCNCVTVPGGGAGYWCRQDA